jgi:hypothetical protein
MCRDIIRQDEHWRLAVAHEIARHCEDEVGIGAGVSLDSPSSRAGTLF